MAGVLTRLQGWAYYSIILLNGHGIKLPYKFISLYLQVPLRPQKFLCILYTVNTETNNWSKCRAQLQTEDPYHISSHQHSGTILEQASKGGGGQMSGKTKIKLCLFDMTGLNYSNSWHRSKTCIRSSQSTFIPKTPPLAGDLLTVDGQSIFFKFLVF